MFIKLTIFIVLTVSNFLYPQLYMMSGVPIENKKVEEIQKSVHDQKETGDVDQGQRVLEDELVPTVNATAEENGVEANPSSGAEAYDEVMTISFAGDCTLGWDDTSSYYNSFPHRLEKEGGDFSYFFKGVKHVFEADDLTLINLETTFTTSLKKADKKFRFKGEPSYTEILKAGSIEMVNIANNHIYDYLDQGFKDTRAALTQGDILYSGEGFVGETTIRGMKIVSLGYRGWDISIKDQVGKDIQKARESGDLVLVSFHWGEERKNLPNKTQKILGYHAIDCGADVVVGHHPHVIQGIEKYKGKYILYSLGNFSFGGNKNPSDKDTFIFQNKLYFKDKVLVKNEGLVIPCKISSTNHINDYQPITAMDEERDRILERILLYSNGLQHGIGREDIIQSEDRID